MECKLYITHTHTHTYMYILHEHNYSQVSIVCNYFLASNYCSCFQITLVARILHCHCIHLKCFLERGDALPSCTNVQYVYVRVHNTDTCTYTCTCRHRHHMLPLIPWSFPFSSLHANSSKGFMS